MEPRHLTLQVIQAIRPWLSRYRLPFCSRGEASAEHVVSAARTRRTALKGRVLLFASSQIGKPLGFPANPLTCCNWAALVCRQ